MYSLVKLSLVAFKCINYFLKIRWLLLKHKSFFFSYPQWWRFIGQAIETETFLVSSGFKWSKKKKVLAEKNTAKALLFAKQAQNVWTKYPNLASARIFQISQERRKICFHPKYLEMADSKEGQFIMKTAGETPWSSVFRGSLSHAAVFYLLMRTTVRAD